MRRTVLPWLSLGLATALLVLPAAIGVDAHGPGDAITWNREIARLVYAKCASCHRPGGTAFPLLTYLDAQPRANEIKDAVLSRRMPPWGAVEGFGRFRNDQSLTQEQIEIITKWVDGGIRRGNNPQMLPKVPSFPAPEPYRVPGTAIRVEGNLTLKHPVTVDALVPERMRPDQSARVVAVLPSGAIEPLVWLHGYDSRYEHPFLFRQPVQLPAGTVIRGVPADASIVLVPVTERTLSAR